MDKKISANKIFLFGVILGLGYFLVPTLSHAMEIIFDKEYNISKKANITSLNWKAVTFSKVGAGRVKYTLKAEHQDGVTLEYLKDIDSMISKGIKNKMIGSYEVKNTKVEFQNGIATLEVEVPYDFETRYLPVKVIKKEGFEDYVVRLRFGDYKFLMANKVLNATGTIDPSKIASKDHRDLYKNRKQLKRREVVKDTTQTQNVSVDEIYSDAKGTSTTNSVATSSSPKAPVVSEDASVYDQFENLAKQYEEEASIKNEPVEISSAEDLSATPSLESQVSEIANDAASSYEAPKLAETLPAKDVDIVADSTPMIEEVSDEVSVDDMLADEDKPASQTISSVGTTVPSYADQLKALQGEDGSAVESDPIKGTSQDVIRSISSSEEKAKSKTEEDGVYGIKPQTWNFVYSTGFVFGEAKAEVVKEKPAKVKDEEQRTPSSEDNTGLSTDDLDTELSFEDEEASKKKDW